MANAVTSNQTDIYKNLEQVVRKYATTCFLRPVADHTREAFAEALRFIEEFHKTHGTSDRKKCTDECAGATPFEFVLDSGCGTGESTLHLARKFPNVPVIGVDKSAMRLNKAGNIHQLEQLSETASSQSEQAIPKNAFWVRAELLDFWRLTLDAVNGGSLKILHHAVFYPNPWPKESEATRRFHLHPIFPTMMALSSVTEMRTNWEIYAKEFAEASRILCDVARQGNLVVSASSPAIVCSSPAITCEPFDPVHPETAFERKYKEARQQLWRVLVKHP